MAIKEYSNKSSVLKKRSRYVHGGDTTVNKKRLGWWEKYLFERNDVTDIRVYIDSKYDRRPDLVAFDFYGDATLEWIILQSNNIVDVVEEFTLGKTITIPSSNRVFFTIMTKPTKVQESKI